MSKQPAIRISARDRERWERMAAVEADLRDAGFASVAGVDEAGRGPLAGPVVAAACVLPPDETFYGLNDSKKMTPRRRDVLYEQLCEKAVFAVGIVSPNVIDRINILQATCQAMRQAVAKLASPPDYVLFDALIPSGFQLPARAILKGDANVNAIAAASILAKVTRDRLMIEFDERYPEYGFAAHKGYGTRHHVNAIRTFGPCPIHRHSFLGNILPEDKRIPPHLQAGEKAEQFVAQQLQAQGYEILDARYAITGYGELDIVCRKNKVLYFVEVKARTEAASVFGDSADAIDRGKRERIKIAAACYLERYNFEDSTCLFLAALVELNADQEPRHIRFVPF